MEFVKHANLISYSENNTVKEVFSDFEVVMCPTNGPKPKDIEFTIDRLEPENV